MDIAAPSFQRESLLDVWNEVQPLLYKHWQEISRYPDIPLDVNLDVYRALEANDRLRIYTARVPDNFAKRLIGYAAFVVDKNPHYNGSTQASQDVLYIDPDYRRGYAGIKLILYTMKELAAEGVQVATQHVKLAHPALGKILSTLGWEPVETIHAIRLDEWAKRQKEKGDGD